MTKKQAFETFEYQRKTDFVERTLTAMRSIIYVVISFFAGFEFHKSQNLLWFGLFWFVLIISFQWERVVKITKRVILK